MAATESTAAAAASPVAPAVDPTIAAVEATSPAASTPIDTLSQMLGAPPPGAAEGALSFFNPGALPYAVAILVASAVVVRLLRQGGDSLAKRLNTQRLLIKQTTTLAGFAIYGVAFLTALFALFDFSPEALLALSGTLAVAGGFLLKDVAESTMAGISILVTRPFQVGDRIQFGDYYGEVEDIGLRSVRLVTLDDNLVTIPSNQFLTESVASANAGELDCMVVIPFYVDCEADHDRAREIVRDAVLSSRFLYLGKPVTVLVAMKLVNEVGALVELTAKAYVFDARHEKAFASDVTQRALRAFLEAGIAMPRAA